MKRVLSIYVAVLLTALVTSTPAFAATWSNNHTIVAVEPHIDGFAWVLLERDNDAMAAEGCTTDDVRLDVGSDPTGIVFKTILTAYLAGKSVDIQIKKASSGSNCDIVRVRAK
ncbi:MAG: hypothetical protein OXR73_32525 [Myxococcales bacterium]|nr:hypothetical protein [Myxococcales bacterium]